MGSILELGNKYLRKPEVRAVSIVVSVVSNQDSTFLLELDIKAKPSLGGNMVRYAVTFPEAASLLHLSVVGVVRSSDVSHSDGVARVNSRVVVIIIIIINSIVPAVSAMHLQADRSSLLSLHNSGVLELGLALGLALAPLQTGVGVGAGLFKSCHLGSQVHHDSYIARAAPGRNVEASKLGAVREPVTPVTSIGQEAGQALDLFLPGDILSANASAHLGSLESHRDLALQLGGRLSPEWEHGVTVGYDGVHGVTLDEEPVCLGELKAGIGHLGSPSLFAHEGVLG